MAISHKPEFTYSKKGCCFTWSQIAAHNTRESCYIVINGNVYDVTEWLPKHPGGESVILNMCGVDCTDIFNAYHPIAIRDRMLEPYRIGYLEDSKVRPLVTQFRDFAKSIESSDLMCVKPSFYTKLVFWYAILFFGAVFSILSFPESFWCSAVLGGLLMGAFFQQVAFMGHDLGHTAVFHERSIDSKVGLFFGNMLSGVSIGWWKATHNTHHVITNSTLADPDIQHIPVFAVSSKFFEGIYSTYHERLLKFGTFAKILVPWQSKLYYPVMAVARVNLYIQSYLFLLSGGKFSERRIRTHFWSEMVGLVAFAVWFGLLTMQIQNVGSRIAFLVISHAFAGILHVQITLSHFAMTTYSEKHPLEVDSFLEHQLKTCLDIDCFEWLDWFHGGLQFQVAHHLFPRVPRCNLRRLRELVTAFCESHSLEYKRVDFLSANRMMIEHLAAVGDECRASIVSDMLNLRG